MTEPVREPAVAEMSRSVAARTAFSFKAIRKSPLLQCLRLSLTSKRSSIVASYVKVPAGGPLHDDIRKGDVHGQLEKFLAKTVWRQLSNDAESSYEEAKALPRRMRFRAPVEAEAFPRHTRMRAPEAPLVVGWCQNQPGRVAAGSK